MGTVHWHPPGSCRPLAGTMGSGTWHSPPPKSIRFASWTEGPCLFPHQPQLEQTADLHTCRAERPHNWARLTRKG